MDYIPYYDFSYFPLQSDNLIKNIELSIEKGFDTIFINFGEYFPWSEDTIINSKFAYSDKLIDKIVEICKDNNINLIPVLSVLVNSDFILRDNKYKYLLNNGIWQNELDISSCGVSKLVEELIDDIFSLIGFSNYLLFELPDIIKTDKNSNQSEIITQFIDRLTEHLASINKTLILGYNKKNKSTKYYFAKEKIVTRNYYNTHSIKKGKFYNLDINTSTIILKGIEYKVSNFIGTDNFCGDLDIGNFNLENDYNIGKDIFLTSVDKIENFYLILNRVWDYIRICWENLSLFYNNIESVQRMKFMRSVILLKQNYSNFEVESRLLFNNFEKKFQPFFFKNWMDGKTKSILNQINTLESISLQMNVG